MANDYTLEGRLPHPVQPSALSRAVGGRVRIGLAALALTLAAGPLRAEVLLSPSVGLAFGGKTDDSKIAYGGTLTFKGSVVGFAVDFGYIPDFFGSGSRNNNLVTLMGNLVVMSRGTVRVYGSGGLGLVKSRVESASGLLEADSNELGLGVGGGLLVLPGDGSLGLHGDIRYFRSLTDPERDNEFDVQLGDLDFWRGEIGVTIRF